MSSAHASHLGMAHEHYGKLMLMTALSFGAMYVLMYAMVNSLDDVFANINKAYMAGLMAAPMVLIELAVMGGMYGNKKLNAILMAASIVVLVALWGLIRTQTAVGDMQFLKAMIPHHSSAILMCERASISDPDIQELCRGIVKSQADEIRQMKAMLEERGR